MIASSGTVVDATTNTSRDKARWFAEHLGGAPVRLDATASSLLAEHLGEDVGRLSGLVETLAAAYGEGATINEGQLAPYLGEAGDVPPWDLTDAIDQGDADSALVALSRMMEAGGRSGPEIVGVLHRHIENMFLLDGSPANTAEEAAQLLGARSPFVARKALSQSRRLGSERLGEAIMLLSQADLDIKGQSALPQALILEVLVARLSRLARTGSTRSTGRRGQRSKR